MTELAAPPLLTIRPADLEQIRADEIVGITVASVSPKKQAYLRFRQHKAAVVSVFVMAILVPFVLLTPITARYGVNEPVIDI